MNWTKDIEIFNSDCMEAMREMKDNEFDLAIVDPPYGIGIAEWDSKTPTKDFFLELFRVANDSIIWGANYFHLPHSESWICWHKTDGFKRRAFDGASDFELAWTSHDKKARYFPYTYSGNIEGLYKKKPNYKASKRIHPTEKPIQLYNWLLDNYAKEGHTILDTHLGSGSIAIACHYRGFKLTGYEIDSDYYESALKRFKTLTAQTQLF